MVMLASDSMCARPKSVIQSFGVGFRGRVVQRRSDAAPSPCPLPRGRGERDRTSEHQVRGLDVAVDDAHLVGVVEGFGGLDAELGDAAEEVVRCGA